MTALWFALACTSTTLVVGEDPEDTGGDPQQDSGLPGDTSADTADTGDVEDTGPQTWPQPCSSLYDPDTLVEFDLDFEPDDLATLRGYCSQGNQGYVPVKFSWQGETVDAQVRLKGNWSWSCDKLQFVVSFNEDDPDGRFHGQRKLVLDAPWYDRTVLHERLAYPLFEARGLPYSCANNARVNIDGRYYGLYANLERLDKEYLERNFEESDGNLYQGGAELKTNEDVADTSRLTALNAATSIEELEGLADLDQAVAEWAMEAMIPAMDNYWAGVEINYYLYDHPSRGFVWLPYDLDISFGDSAYSDGSLVWPDTVGVDPLTYEHTGWQKEALAERVLSDRHWCGRFVEELVLAREVYDPGTLEAQLDVWSEQIADAYADDPNAHASRSEHEASVAQLRRFFQDRADVVDAWLADGDHCPAHF